ncbi:glycosyltransferase family 2 protein [Rahnella variigena]|jgi:rhamnosyltransferase|uniref:glycosyltransferase family 2 protein n=1 Tax=Rahnella variigena TaxID=574964 RepID=UPI0013302E86|nr:glycosyltransferase family 2 protein [Rahnella variigena]
MENNVCGIIVTYKPNLSDLRLLISSLIDQVQKIIIVNNGSDTPLEEEVGQSRVEIFTLESNVGIGAAQNIGVDKAIEQNYKYVCLFDQDSRLEQNFISSLLEAFNELKAENINVGALGPLIVDERSGKQFPFYLYDNNQRLVIEPEKVNHRYIETHQLISSGTFFPTSVWPIVGKNHEGFFLEYVDTDWCLRLVNLGFKIFGVKDAKLIHKLGDDRKKIFNRIEVPVHSTYRYFYVFRNGTFCSLYRPFPGCWRRYNIFRLFCFYIIMLLIKKDKFKLSKYVFLGVYDGIKKNFSRKLF